MSIFTKLQSFFSSGSSNRGNVIDYQPPKIQPLGRTHKKEFDTQRGYDAASIDRLTADWTTRVTSGDAELRQAYRILLARSREQERNNPHIVRYISMLVNNVIGALGPSLDMKVKNLDGTPDTQAIDIITTQWKAWGKKGQCTLDKGHTFRSLIEMVLTRSAIDGVFFLRRIQGSPNSQRFAVQCIEAQYLDYWYNVPSTDGGAQIRMGVEVDANTGEKLAYYFLKYDPTDLYMSQPTDPAWRVRVPASEVIQVNRQSRVMQTLAAPWTVSTMKTQQFLASFIEAEVVAARESACKGGFFKSQNGDQFAGDGEYPDGDVVVDMEPGVARMLPKGIDFQAYDPTHPNVTFREFVKSMLMIIAAGNCVDYPTLASDLEGVNYSSAKMGQQETREEYKKLQQWLIEFAIQPIFDWWLETELDFTTNLRPLPSSKFLKFSDATRWKCRRWASTEKLTDVQASVMAIQNGLSSRQKECAEVFGIDFEEICAEQNEDKQTAEAHGLEFNTEPINPKADQQSMTEQPDNGADPATTPKANPPKVDKPK